MSLHDDLEDALELARTVISDKKAEKEKAEQERKTVQLVCPYCGTSSRFVWEEGKLPSCPNCGAAFEEDARLEKMRSELDARAEAERRKREAEAAESEKTKRKIRRYIIIGIVVIAVLIAAVIAAKLNGGSLHFNGDASFHFQIS